MSNKIGSGGVDGAPAQVGTDRSVNRTKESAGAAPTVTTPPAKSSGVQITDSARQLAALEKAIRELPDIDQNRVAQVRAAIAQGTYNVSPDRIADKLIRLEGELR